MDTLWIVFVGALIACVASVVIFQHYQKKEYQQKTAIFRQYAQDFAKVGWGTWGYSVHVMSGQKERMERAIYSKKMLLLSYDPESHTAHVLGERGSEYIIDEFGCSCPDFQKRFMPCKHMYFAVMEITGENGD